MPSITDLKCLLRSIEPQLQDTEFVFCTVEGDLSDYISLQTIATFMEPEGLSLVLKKSVAEQAKLDFENTYKLITLSVHSSLEAVGLTAAVSTALAKEGISANVIAAYHHDHVFVPARRANDALACLKLLAEEA
jgi:hypothetical protein